MKNENFDKEAMERKIKKNLDKGFTIEGILLALKEELKTTLRGIQALEARGLELSDQIEYMEEKRFGKSDGS
jgi:hypothetical protein